MAASQGTDVNREVEKSTGQLNLALSHIIISRLPILQKMIDFLNRTETRLFSDEVFELSTMKFFNAEGEQIDVFNSEGRKLDTIYDLKMLRDFYEKVNKDFLNILEFIRKYTSKIPLESGNELTEREKDIMRVLSQLSDEELAEISRIVYERQSKKK